MFSHKTRCSTVAALLVAVSCLGASAASASAQGLIKGAMVVDNFLVDRYFKAQRGTAGLAVADGTGGGPPAGTRILTLSGTVYGGVTARVFIQTPMPGKVTKITLYIRGDGNPVSLGTIFNDRFALIGSGETASYAPDQFQSNPTTLVDWKGWKKVTVNVPIPKTTTFNERGPARSGSVMDFPLSLGGFVIAHGGWAMKDNDPRKKTLPTRIKGNVAFALISAEGQIRPAEQYWARADMRRPGNVMAKGEDATVYIYDRAAGGGHKVRCEIQALDAAGRVALEHKQDLTTRGGTVTPIKLATGKLSVGWYRLVVNLIQNKKTVFLFRDPEKDYTAQEKAAFEQMPILQVLRAPSFSIVEAKNIPSKKDYRRIFESPDNLTMKMEEDTSLIFFTWDDIERRQTRWQWYKKIFRSDNVQDFYRRSLDEMVDQTRAAGLEPVGKLCFTTQWAALGVDEDRRTGQWKGSHLAPPRDKRFFEDYVYRVVKRYRDKIKVWEVWNEPDMSTYYGDRPDLFVETLIKPAYEAAKRADPDCTVLVGGVTIENFQRYVIGLAKTKVSDKKDDNGAKYFDGVSLHVSSSFLAPEESEFIQLIEGARPYLSAKMGKGREPIFWLSQVSFPSGVAKHGITTGLQAAYMARAFIIAKAAGINRFLAVLASLGRKEDGSGVIYKERLPCIFPIGAPEQPTYSLKAGFLMMRGVRRQMKGMKFVRVAMLQDVTPGLPQCFIFSNNQNATFVIWRLRGDVNMKFTPPPGVTMSARDGYGNPMPIGAKGGKSMLTVGPFPTFVQVPVGSMAKFEQALLAAVFEPVTGKPTSWRSRLVGHINLDSPQQRQAHQYKVVGGKVAREKAATTSGKVVEGSCATFEGEESFKVKLPAEKTPFDLVIVRSLLMTEKGESITVSCNDQEVGKLVFGMGLKPKNAYRLWSHETIVVPATLLKKNPKEALIKIKTDPARKGVKARSGSYWFYIKPAGQALNLSDLEPLAYRRPWGQLYHDGNIGGAVFDVSGKEYPRGLGTTADSRITFIIGGKFKTLTGKIGIDALAENNTRVRASIYLDGRVAWKQRGIKKGMKPVEFEVPMDGKSQIILEVRSESGKLRYDFVDWLNVELR